MVIVFSIFLIGFTAMAAQIVIMRELSIVFYGNEISIGFILGSWLIWGALGSWLLGRFASRVNSKLNLLSICQFVLSFFPVLSILAIRLLKHIFRLAPGEIIGFIPMFISSLFVLAPICLLLGFMFSLVCLIYQAKSGLTAQIIGKAYAWESIGSMLGGLLISFIFMRLFNSVVTGVILGLLNISAAICLRWRLKKGKLGRLFSGISVFIFIVALALCFFRIWDKLDASSRKNQWESYKILETRNSLYGNIMLTKSGSQYSFFDNGLFLYSTPDKLASEEAVHFVLLEHTHPQDVLLIGGGVGGLIEDILKYPIRNIDYLELDPAIIAIAAKFFPQEMYQPLRNSKVSIFNLDGRFFIKSTHKKYDCVITHLGDPYTAQVNRYYTIEFFKEVKRVLNEGGIFSFALSSSESYISSELAEYLRSVYLGLKEVFKDVLVIPGDTAYFLASDKVGALTYNYNILMQRAKERNLDLKYVRKYYLASKLSPQLLAYMQGVLLQKGKVKLNYDFNPSTYYYNMTFWAARWGNSIFKKILKAVSFEKIIKVVFGICVLIIFTSLIAISRNKDFYKQASPILLIVTGFSAMTIQLILLLTFQIIYGFVFYKIGFLLTIFMFGLASGSFCMAILMKQLKNPLSFLIQSNLLFCILSTGLPALFFWLLTSNQESISVLGANVVFPLLSVIVGLLAGAQFLLVNKIYLDDFKNVKQVVGVTYAADLLGSCFGAFFTVIFLIPILGVNWSCWVIGLINFSVFIVLILSRFWFLA